MAEAGLIFAVASLVIQGIDLSEKFNNLKSRFQNASQTISSISNDVLATTQTLERLAKCLNQSGNSGLAKDELTSGIEAHIVTCTLIFNEIGSVLDQSDESDRVQKGGMGKRARFKIALRHEKVIEWKHQLNHIKMDCIYKTGVLSLAHQKIQNKNYQRLLKEEFRLEQRKYQKKSMAVLIAYESMQLASKRLRMESSLSTKDDQLNESDDSEAGFVPRSQMKIPISNSDYIDMSSHGHDPDDHNPNMENPQHETTMQETVSTRQGLLRTLKSLEAGPMSESLDKSSVDVMIERLARRPPQDQYVSTGAPRVVSNVSRPPTAIRPTIGEGDDDLHNTIQPPPPSETVAYEIENKDDLQTALIQPVSPKVNDMAESDNSSTRGETESRSTRSAQVLTSSQQSHQPLIEQPLMDFSATRSFPENAAGLHPYLDMADEDDIQPTQQPQPKQSVPGDLLSSRLGPPVENTMKLDPMRPSSSFDNPMNGYAVERPSREIRTSVPRRREDNNLGNSRLDGTSGTDITNPRDQEPSNTFVTDDALNFVSRQSEASGQAFGQELNSKQSLVSPEKSRTFLQRFGVGMRSKLGTLSRNGFGAAQIKENRDISEFDGVTQLYEATSQDFDEESDDSISKKWPIVEAWALRRRRKRDFWRIAEVKSISWVQLKLMTAQLEEIIYNYKKGETIWTDVVGLSDRHKQQIEELMKWRNKASQTGASNARQWFLACIDPIYHETRNSRRLVVIITGIAPPNTGFEYRFFDPLRHSARMSTGESKKSAVLLSRKHDPDVFGKKMLFSSQGEPLDLQGRTMPEIPREYPVGSNNDRTVPASMLRTAHERANDFDTVDQMIDPAHRFGEAERFSSSKSRANGEYQNDRTRRGPYETKRTSPEFKITRKVSYERTRDAQSVPFSKHETFHILSPRGQQEMDADNHMFDTREKRYYFRNNREPMSRRNPPLADSASKILWNADQVSIESVATSNNESKALVPFLPMHHAEPSNFTSNRLLEYEETTSDEKMVEQMLQKWTNLDSLMEDTKRRHHRSNRIRKATQLKERGYVSPAADD